jgi:aminoglycoside phosphotransferase (APT) family kinase protein
MRQQARCTDRTPSVSSPTHDTSEGARPPAGVAACLAEIADDDSVAWSGVVAERIHSRIHRASRGSMHVAIKECFDPTTLEPSAESAEREFVALQRIAASTTAKGRLALAPTPLALCRGHGSYAMSWVDGRSITEALLATSCDATVAVRLGTHAGKWLREFHALRALPQRCSDFAAKIPYVRQILATREDDTLVRRAAEVLSQNASAAAAIELPASWVHGDMKSDNLLIAEDRVVGLDAQLNHENTVAYDLAPFLNHLRLLRWSGRGFRRRRAAAIVAENFTRSYSTAARDWSLPVAWLRAYLLLQIVAPSDCAASLRSRIARWPARIELASILKKLERTQ